MNDVCDVPKVGGLQSGRSSLGNAQKALKMAVQRVQKAITESPKKEKNCDKAKRDDRFPQSKLCRTSALVIFGLQTSSSDEFLYAHDGKMIVVVSEIDGIERQRSVTCSECPGARW